MSGIYTCDNCGKTAESSFMPTQSDPRPLEGWWGTPGGYDACCDACYTALLQRIVSDENCERALRNEAGGLLDCRKEAGVDVALSRGDETKRPQADTACPRAELAEKDANIAELRKALGAAKVEQGCPRCAIKWMDLREAKKTIAQLREELVKAGNIGRIKCKLCGIETKYDRDGPLMYVPCRFCGSRNHV